MRIIAGSARGHRLVGPPGGAATRPTSDKVREAIFNVLGAHVVGARTLDLFAGTGALGIEALSRGAASATFVESERALSNIVRKNLATTRFEDRAHVLCRDVRRAAGGVRARGPFDLVLIDPPYGFGLEHDALQLIVSEALLAPGAYVVVEHSSRDVLQLDADVEPYLAIVRTKDYGDTTLTCYVAKDQLGGSQAMPRIAIYPGSFDPLTKGHHDVIQRSLVMFDKLIIAVAGNVRKQALFSMDERIALIREVVGDDPRVEVDTFEGLLVEYAKRKGAVALVRGLRAVADFEFEFEMASMNRRLAPNVETVFLMTHEAYFYVSSHLVKEVAMLGGEFEAFVPAPVAAKLKARLEELKK